MYARLLTRTILSINRSTQIFMDRAAVPYHDGHKIFRNFNFNV